MVKAEEVGRYFRNNIHHIYHILHKDTTVKVRVVRLWFVPPYSSNMSKPNPGAVAIQMVLCDYEGRKLKRKGCNGKLSNGRKVERLEDETKPNFIDFTVEYGSDRTGPPPPWPP
ncbi:NAC domain-containing protein 83-like [Senna tora]|uniref:NAC domain-containing protein 83-like n=1 Tax=Senna tora TaxID=362788 RepID=A0A834SEK9_9FABA|nr:NAC domain-containing protein 83-like [Senna tora]